jgi:hypothetical protein
VKKAKCQKFLLGFMNCYLKYNEENFEPNRTKFSDLNQQKNSDFFRRGNDKNVCLDLIFTDFF